MLRIEEIVGAMDDEFRYALDALGDERLDQLAADKSALRRLRPVGVSNAEALEMIATIQARRVEQRRKAEEAEQRKVARKEKRKAAPRRKKTPVEMPLATAVEPPLETAVEPPLETAVEPPAALPAPPVPPQLPPPAATGPAIRLPPPVVETPTILLPSPPPKPVPPTAPGRRLMTAALALTALAAAMVLLAL